MELNAQKTALLVIDMQNDFFASQGDAALRGKAVSQMQALVNPLNRFIAALRSAGVKIIFTKFISGDGVTPTNLAAQAKRHGYNHSCIQGTIGAELAGMDVADDDIVITKPHFDAFAYTKLLSILKGARIENVLVCGVRTEVCVDISAKRAASEGFCTVLVSDLIGTYDDKSGLNQSIAEFFDIYFGYSLSSQELLQVLKVTRP